MTFTLYLSQVLGLQTQESLQDLQSVSVMRPAALSLGKLVATQI